MGLTATFHIHKGIDDPQKMTVKQLLELLEAGMGIGGHTRTHPALTRISELQATDEIAGCKADIESALSIPVKLFAYPGGVFNSSIVRIVREAGYIAACSIIGFGQNDISSLFWLYRDVLTEEKNNLHDLFIFSPLARRLVFLRNKRLLQRKFD